MKIVIKSLINAKFPSVLILGCCFFPTISHTQPTLLWAKGFGGPSGDKPFAVTVDASGNVYTTGKFSGIGDFDPGAGTVNLTSTGVFDIFVSKLDVSGNFVWAKAMGGANPNDEGHSIAVDASGNVYTTGRFGGTADFDPGAGVFNLTASGVSDVFVSKLDAAGNFVWAKAMGGGGIISQIDEGHSVAVDALGNVYTTGRYFGTSDFDPGVGVFNLNGAGVFVSKLDASGNFVWAKQFSGSGSTGYSIAVDVSGNVYSTGKFFGTVDFDPGAGIFNLVSAGVEDIFISKLDASGNFVWAKRIGNAGVNVGYSIAVDASGNVFTTGSFDDAVAVDFDPGAGTFNLTSAGIFDIFISKLNAAGNFLLAKRIGNTASDFGRSITLDASGNVYIMGQTFSATVDIDPNAGIFNVIGSGGGASIIGKYDNNLNFICGFSIPSVGTFSGTANFDGERTIAVLGSNAHIIGVTDAASSPPADFDPCGAQIINVPTPGNTDNSVAKYDMSVCSGACFVLPIKLLHFTANCTNYAVQLNWATATEINNDYFTIERSTDAVNFEPVATIQGAGISNIIQNYNYMDVTSNPPVIGQALEPQTSNTLYYRLKQTDFDGQFEYFDVIAVKNCEQKNGTFNIYPNPANRFFSFMIQGSNEDLLVEVYNHLGAVVIHQAYTNLEKSLPRPFGGTQHTIKTNELAQGIYLVKFSQGVNQQTSKLIINR